MAKFDIDLVGKVGSLALIDKAYGDINYSTIARISRELRPGIIWVTSGATEIGRLDFIKRTGRELTGSDEDNKPTIPRKVNPCLWGGIVSSLTAVSACARFLWNTNTSTTPKNVNILKKCFCVVPKKTRFPS